MMKKLLTLFYFVMFLFSAPIFSFYESCADINELCEIDLSRKALCYRFFSHETMRQLFDVMDDIITQREHFCKKKMPLARVVVSYCKDISREMEQSSKQMRDSRSVVCKEFSLSELDFLKAAESFFNFMLESGLFDESL